MHAPCHRARASSAGLRTQPTSVALPRACAGERHPVTTHTLPSSHLAGECYHEDHHSHPAKFMRPGTDLPYWYLLRPLFALGVIDARHNNQKVE